MAGNTPKSHEPKGTPLPSTSLPDAIALTDRISIGRTGRAWHLPFDAYLSRTPDRTGRCGIDISTPIEAVVVRQACEFLRDHVPQTYAPLWAGCRILNPVENQKHPTIKRLARDMVVPQSMPDGHELKATDHHGSREAPFTIKVPEISKSHWAYKRHYNVGNYITSRSGDREALATAEARSDITSILSYIERYRDLAKELTGKNLWSATHEPGFRDPYFTCMELSIGEAQVPSHMLALIHYGIGIQMMYELSLPWHPPKSMDENRVRVIEACKDGFRALARLYREDFC